MQEEPQRSTVLFVFLAAELSLAVLFGLFSWSMTKSLAQGRIPSLYDTAALALPALLVLACGYFALRLWRRGKRKDAWGLAVVPFPLALVLFVALGAI